MEAILFAVFFIGLVCGLPTATQQRNEAKRTLTDHRQFFVGNRVRDQDEVIDVEDLTLTIDSWNRDSDATNGMLTIIDFKRGVAGFALPQEEKCFIIENVLENLPVPEFNDGAEVRGKTLQPNGIVEYAPRVLLDATEVIELMPPALAPLCTQWPTYTARPSKKNLESELDDARDWLLERKKRSWGQTIPFHRPSEELRYCLWYFLSDVCMPYGF